MAFSRLQLGPLAAVSILAIQFFAPSTVLAPEGPGEQLDAMRAAPTGAWQSRRKAKQPKPKFTPHIGDLAAARKASLEQNVPLLIHIILEDEEQNDEYRDDLLPDKELIAASQLAVVIVTNNGDHAPRRIKENIEGREVKSEVCSKYPTFAHCGQHREAWDDVYAIYHEEDGSMRCPQTVILAPDGTQAWRNNDGNPPAASAVVSQLIKAQKKAGPGLSREQLTRVKQLTKEGQRASDGKLWGDAWRKWSEVLELSKVGAYGEQAGKAMREAETAMRAELAKLLTGLVPGSAAQAYAELSRLVTDWAGSPLEPEVRKRIKAAEKNKEIKEEIARWKLEAQADALWDEGIALWEKGEERAAMKILKKLVRKKYVGTAAAARTLEKFPELAPSDKE